MKISWTDKTGSAQEIQFDCEIRAEHEISAEVSAHPVESGADVSDHVRANNPTLTLEGIVSNAPIKPIGEARGDAHAVEIRLSRGTVTVTALQWDSRFDRVRSVDSICQELISAGQIVSISTNLRQYQSMALKRFKVEDTAQNGNALRVVIDAVRVRVVTTQSVAVPPAPVHRRDIPARQRGGQTTTPVTPAVRESLAHSALDALTGLFHG